MKINAGTGGEKKKNKPHYHLHLGKKTKNIEAISI